MRDDDGTGSTPTTRHHRVRRAHLQIVFVTHLGGVVRCDALALSEFEWQGRHVPSGAPLTLSIRSEVPDQWGALWAIMQGWAERMSTIRVDIGVDEPMLLLITADDAMFVIDGAIAGL